MKGRSLSEVLQLAKKYGVKGPVVVYPRGKDYILRYYTKKPSNPKTKKQLLQRAIFGGVSSEYRKETTKYARDGFELGAKSLGGVYKQNKIDIVKNDGIIPKRNVLMSGFNLYIRSDMLRASIGLPPVYEPAIGVSKPIMPEIISAELTPDGEAVDIYIEQFVRKSDDYDIIRVRLFGLPSYIIRGYSQILAVLDLPKEKRVVGKNILHVRLESIPFGGKLWGNKDIPIKLFPRGKITFKADTVAVEKIDAGAVVSSPSNKVSVEFPQKRRLAKIAIRLRKRLQSYARRKRKEMLARKIKDGSIKDYREARRESRHRYYFKNSEKCLAYYRRYYIRKRKKISAQHQEYYLKNREKILTQRRRYWLENYEEISAKAREYYIKNHKKTLARMRRYRLENHKEILTRSRKYYIKNREKISARRRLEYLERKKRQNRN